MSAILGTAVTGAGGGAYTINNSLRIRSSASAYLYRTPASAGNAQKFTMSCWVKIGSDPQSSAQITFLNAGNGSQTNSTNDEIQLRTNGTALQVGVLGKGGTGGTYAQFTPYYRDYASWYHVVVAIDTTQATQANRCRAYVNGVEVTNFVVNGFTLNYSFSYLNGASAHLIGRNNEGGGPVYTDAYFAEYNFIDGQQLTPSSFGATDASTGVWQPKAYTGSYGTNGFYLKFSDIATTSGSNAGLGKDFSGNANYWNTNNISVTAGSTYDAMKDVPTNTSATVANYATLNPLSNSYSGTTVVSSITNGNLTFSDSSSSNRVAIASMTAPSGKWYFEMTSSSTGTYAVGLMDKVSNAGSFYRNNGTYSSSFGGGGTSGYSSWTSGDVIGVAWDADSGKLWFAKNNTWQGSGNPSAGTNPTNTFTAGLSLFADIYTDNSAGTKSGSFNFGQQPFVYTPPTNFVALNTFNLPTPTIGASSTTLANKYFDISLWTGNGTSQSITNSGSFQPDFVWYKGRNTTFNNALFDAIRGVLKTLYSNTVGSENTSLGTLTAFNSNGFSVGDDAGANQNTSTYVGWQWNGGGSNATNTSGSITSTVRANTTSGFSIVTYTGTGANATVGHGLGVAPRMILLKQRNGSTYAWNSYHASLGNTYYIQLNTASQADNSVDLWNSTTPTTTVFSLSGSVMNNNGGTYVAYCFAPIAGYSAFGSYTGNGSTDGPFVFTGFRPKFVMFKRTDSSGSWHIFDSSINTYNAATQNLYPNGTNTETANNTQDLLSNGFKCRSTDTDTNASGGTYIYAAFAEYPFKYANAR